MFDVVFFFFFFFFQAEDGIRDLIVTGVQTCALPILDLQIERVERLVAERKLALEVTPAAKQLIVAEGYDPVYGARPLKRAIQRLLQNPLALAVLEGKFAEGDRIRVDRAKDGNSLTFQRVAAAAPEAARA